MNIKKISLVTTILISFALATYFIYANNFVRDTEITNGFFTSYAGSVEQNLKKHPLVGYAPTIGKYDQEVLPGEKQYNFLQSIIFIENKPRALLNTAPESLLKSIYGMYTQAPANREQMVNYLINNAQVNFFTIFFGGPFFEKPQNRIYNLVFHPVVRKWLQGKPGIDINNFNINASVGIFDPKRVKGISVAVNSLKPEAVSIHPSGNEVAFSPDNLQIQIDNGTVASFWSALVAPDKTKITVVFNVVIDNEKLENQIGSIARKSKDVLQLIELLSPLEVTISDEPIVADAIAKLVSSLKS